MASIYMVKNPSNFIITNTFSSITVISSLISYLEFKMVGMKFYDFLVTSNFALDIRDIFQVLKVPSVG